MELSPGSFRTFVVGTSYQLGNLVSSASSTIESTAGEHFPLSPLIGMKDGKVTKTSRYNYGLVICIFMGCVYAYTILLTFVGPENLMKQFGVEQDEDMAVVAGMDTIEAALNRRRDVRVDSDGVEGDGEKGGGKGVEEV